MSRSGLLHKGSYRSGSCLPLWPHVTPTLCFSCSVFQQYWPSPCFLNVPRLLYLLSFHLELFFLWSFLGGFLPSSLKSFVASSEKSSQNTQSSIACASTCDHYHIIEYSLCHLSLSEIILFIYLLFFFPISLIKIEIPWEQEHFCSSLPLYP